MKLGYQNDVFLNEESLFWIISSGFNFFQKHIDFSAFYISDSVSI